MHDSFAALMLSKETERAASTRVLSIAYIKEPIARENYSLSGALHTYPFSGDFNLLVSIGVATGLDSHILKVAEDPCL